MIIVSVLFLITDAFAIRFYVSLGPKIIIEFIGLPLQETVERLSLKTLGKRGRHLVSRAVRGHKRLILRASTWGRACL